VAVLTANTGGGGAEGGAAAFLALQPDKAKAINAAKIIAVFCKIVFLFVFKIIPLNLN
jgi:hypothetical protein